MLSFESVKLRLEREQPLTFLEFNYMLLQAYDFVELHRRYGCRSVAAIVIYCCAYIDVKLADAVSRVHSSSSCLSMTYCMPLVQVVVASTGGTTAVANNYY
eukprot:15539-Heterococcus_DN1.PRE.6